MKPDPCVYESEVSTYTHVKQLGVVTHSPYWLDTDFYHTPVVMVGKPRLDSCVTFWTVVVSS